MNIFPKINFIIKEITKSIIPLSSCSTAGVKYLKYRKIKYCPGLLHYSCLNQLESAWISLNQLESAWISLNLLDTVWCWEKSYPWFKVLGWEQGLAPGLGWELELSQGLGLAKILTLGLGWELGLAPGSYCDCVGS